jgi:hypothetical protein
MHAVLVRSVSNVSEDAAPSRIDSWLAVDAIPPAVVRAP